jgi:hypothetical protein
MFNTGKGADEVVKEKGLVQISDTSELTGIIEKVIQANPQSVADYMAGKEKAIGFMVGQVMKQSQGRANPGMVNAMLKEKLQHEIKDLQFAVMPRSCGLYEMYSAVAGAFYCFVMQYIGLKSLSKICKSVL